MPGLPESTRLATPSGHPESGRAIDATTIAGPSRYAMRSTEHGQYHSGGGVVVGTRVAPPFGYMQ
jgi:hypothetical protein